MVGDPEEGLQRRSSSPNQDDAQLDQGGVDTGGGGGHGKVGAGLTKGNPYAALLQATKIELLETHKNSAVAKRWVFGCWCCCWCCFC